jgi:hypothetical protein
MRKPAREDHVVLTRLALPRGTLTRSPDAEIAAAFQDQREASLPIYVADLGIVIDASEVQPQVMLASGFRFVDSEDENEEEPSYNEG